MQAFLPYSTVATVVLVLRVRVYSMREAEVEDSCPESGVGEQLYKHESDPRSALFVRTKNLT